MASITGTVSPNPPGGPTAWIVTAFDAETHAYAGVSSVTSGAYTITGLTAGRLYALICRPKTGNVWTAQRAVIQGALGVPSHPVTTPYVYEATTATVIAANTRLLVGGLGANDSVPSTLDALGHTPTYTDNARIRTTQYKWSQYGSSLALDGAGDYVTFTSGDMAFASGDFKVAAWIYPTANPASTATIVHFSAGSNGGLHIHRNSGGYLVIDNGLVGTTAGTITIPLNTWSYIEASRVSGTIRGFVGGTQCLTHAAQTYTTATLASVGRYTAAGPSTFSGYLSDVAAVAAAGHSADYTPPSAPMLALTGTSEPTWPTTPDDTVTDGDVEWTNRGHLYQPFAQLYIAS